MRAAAMRRRSRRLVIWKKQATYPHLVELRDWFTWTKEYDVEKRLEEVEAHLAKKDVKRKTSLAGVMQGSRVYAVDVEEMEEEDLADKLVKMDSMPEIVKIKEGSKIRLFVVLLNMGPNNVNTKLTPWVKRKQAKESTMGGQRRGVEEEVAYH